MLHPGAAALGLADLSHSRPAQCNFLSLPNELLLEIAEWLFHPATYDIRLPEATTFRDASAFLLVNHRLYQLFSPYFFRTISKFSWGPPHLGRSILHWAAAHNGNPNLLRRLLPYGGSKMINDVDREGASPLFTAVLHNNATITEFLLKEGADIELEAQSTPLVCAVVFGYYDIVGLLLDAGAYTEERTFTDCTPLHIASMLGNAKEASNIIKALVQAGADTSARQHLGYTPAEIEEKLSEAKALGIYKGDLDLERVTPLYDPHIDQGSRDRDRHRVTSQLADLRALPWIAPLYFLRRQLAQLKEAQHRPTQNASPTFPRLVRQQ